MQLKREGDAMPRYNIFAELANRIKINSEKQQKIENFSDPALQMMHKTDDQENVPPDDKADGGSEALPNMSLI